ncbi:MAG: tyrosine-type recombinase/integrase [Chloroflexi bacterium]|nr:tyrosine-type recombinase/integrase [Chloroflexota bacterium]
MTENAVTQFLESLAQEKAANTLAAYQNDLTQFAAYVEKLDLSWSSVDKSLISSYVLSLKERNYAPATLDRKMAAVRSFFHFLRRQGILAENPAQGIPLELKEKPLPHILSVREVDELLEQPARRSTPEAMRDRAMIGLLYATGMRVGELVSLNIADINLQPPYPHVGCPSRGNRKRDIPMPPETAQALEDYLTLARPRLLRQEDEAALFLNRLGERLTRQGFWLIVKGYAKAAQIGSGMTPHTLRHSFAAHMLSQGGDLRSLQALLGHASTTSTLIYTQLADEKNMALKIKPNPD